MYNLFIDDQIDDINIDTGLAIRDPNIIDPSRKYIAVKTVNEAITLIKQKGCPQFISFDYDLGLDKDGNKMESLELAKWLIEEDLNDPNFIPKEFDYQVHSANIYAKTNLSILRSYLNQK